MVIAIFFLSFTAAVFGAGVALGGSGVLFEPGIRAGKDQPTEFATFWQAWNLVQRHFIDRQSLDNTKLTYGAIQGMINALGDEGHTIFLTPEELKQQQTEISGTFSGIGAQVGVKDSLSVIVSPFDGSPAEKAGVKAGDIIMEVDGEDVTSWPLNEVVNHIRGKAGTVVILTLFRSDENKSVKISITRGEIKVPTATWGMVPGTKVALIRLSQFNVNATQEMVKALNESKTAGATSLIVDLRNNPGGLLEQAVNVTSQFLKDGNVLQQENYDGNRQSFAVKSGGVATDIPLVVLINRGTASASEIFSGAIQDHQRGRVVGEKTFGTGTVLEPFILKDGSGLMLGTSQWLTANGRLIRKQGIKPDVEVELSIGKELLTPAKLKDLKMADLLKNEDTQILKALELLKALPK